MSTIVFDPVEFRQRFPEFEDEIKYPDSLLETYWDMATCYISDQNYGCLSGSCRELALQLMTAHLTRIGTTVVDNPGKNTGFVTSATVDKVSVSTQPPPQGDEYDWWLSLTPYGQQLLGLLKTKSVGGCYIGGSLERKSFRKAGGFF